MCSSARLTFELLCGNKDICRCNRPSVSPRYAFPDVVSIMTDLIQTLLKAVDCHRGHVMVLRGCCLGCTDFRLESGTDLYSAVGSGSTQA